VVAATYVPGGYDDFVRHFIPELQRRGLCHRDCAGTTLQDPRPAAPGGWLVEAVAAQAAAE
jgi:hypothetical protein